MRRNYRQPKSRQHPVGVEQSVQPRSWFLGRYPARLQRRRVCVETNSKTCRISLQNPTLLRLFPYGSWLVLAVILFTPPQLPADVNVWLSDISTVTGDTQIEVHGKAYVSSAASDQLHVWVQTNSATQNLTAVGLNLLSTNADVLDFTEVTVHSPEHVSGGCTTSNNGCRWHFVTEPTPDSNPDQISGLNGAVITNGTGIGADGFTAGDILYDPVSDAWLFASIDFDLTANGSTDLFLQIGDNGTTGSAEEAIDIDFVFGNPNDASLNAQSQRNTNSATADSILRVGGAYWNGDLSDSQAGDGETWADDNNWTTLGVENQGPTAAFPGDVVVLSSAPTVNTIDLGTDRLANSVTFSDNYTLNHHTLTLTAGKISVDSNVVGAINSDIITNNGVVAKMGPGTLIVGGTVSDTFITAGTLQGTGTLASLTVTSDGTVAPGNSSGILTITDDYTQDPGSLLLLEIAGTAAGTTYDVVSVGGNASLSGTLEIQTKGSFLPAAGVTPGAFGNSFVVLSANSVAGTFDTEIGRHIENGRFYFITYGASNVTLNSFQALAGDADGDKDVDITDFNTLATHFDPSGDHSATNNWLTADFDADGDVDITDFNDLATHFTPSGYGAAGSLPVPEPVFSFWLLGGLLPLLFWGREWRNSITSAAC